MNKNVFAVLLVIVSLSVSGSLWFFLPPDDGHILKWSVSIFSLLLFLCIVFDYYWQSVKNKDNTLENEQKSLLKKDIRIIRKLFGFAVKKIRGRGENKLNTNYDLPWYLLLGGGKEDNADFLKQNALELIDNPFFDENLSALYLRFWSNDHFMVIEVGTSIFDEDGVDEDLWASLTKQILKYRPRQGVNGILPVISAKDLLKGGRNDLQKIGSIYQEAILSMNAALKIYIPVYCVILNACEIADFHPFFSNFNQLDNPFGITFSCDPSRRFNKEEMELQTQKLLESLAGTQFELLRNMNSKMSNSVMALPYQLSFFFERVNELLTDIGRENRLRHRVWIRGFYLLSTGRNDLEYDLLTQVVAERAEFNFNPVRETVSKSRSFFASSVFTQVLLPEKNLVGINKLQHFYYMSVRLFLLFFAVGGLSFVGVVLKNNWTQDENWRSEAITQLRLYNSDVLRLDDDYSILETVPLLNNLRTVVLSGVESKPWYNKVSVDQKKTAQRIYVDYQEQLQRVLLPKLAGLISHELSVYVNLGNPSKVFEILRFYQMLFNSKLLYLDEIQDYLLENIQDQINVSPDDLQLLSELIEDLFTSNYDKSLQPNKALIAVAINNLEGLSPERLIYARIKSLPEYRVKVDIRRQLGDKFDSIFEFMPGFHGYMFPEIYTKQGFRELDLSPKSELLRTQLKHFKAVQGDLSAVSLKELMTLSKQVQRFYFSDYIQLWKDLVKKIHVRQFTNLNDLTLAIKNAREPATSPILDVLGALVVNTTLAVEEKPDTKGAKKIAGALGLGSVAKGLGKANKINKLAGDKLLRLQSSFVVNEAFLPFSDYVNGKGTNEDAPIDELIGQFDLLNSYLDLAFLSLNSGKILHGYALVHAGGAQDQIVEFKRVGNKAPEAIAKWANNIAQQVWYQVVNGSSSYINSQWNEMVYQYYLSSIDGRFPFSSRGKGEVVLDDFIHFFKHQGRIDQFVEEMLRPFVVWDNGVLKRNKIEGISFPIRESTLKQIQRARKIGNIFFGQTGQEIRLNIGLRANLMSSNITEFQIREDESVFSYKHGPRVWKSVDWPAIGVYGNLTVNFYQNNNRVATKSYSGQWALFRMLFDGKSTATSNRFVRKLNYKFEDKTIVLDYTLLDSNLELDVSLFNQFNLSKQL